MGRHAEGIQVRQDLRIQAEHRKDMSVMRFPFPEQMFEKCGGVRRGLFVMARNSGQTGFNVMMQFVREFKTSDGAYSYWERYACVCECVCVCVCLGGT